MNSIHEAGWIGNPTYSEWLDMLGYHGNYQRTEKNYTGLLHVARRKDCWDFWLSPVIAVWAPN